MFCPECGTQCDDEQLFCINCGARFGNAAEAVADAVEDDAAEAVAEAAEVCAPEAEDAPVEAPAFDAPAAEAPDFDAPAPAYEPAPPFEPGSVPPPPPPGCMPPPPPFKKCGVGRWIGRIAISLLPILVTYLALFISGVIWPNTLLPTAQPAYMSGYAPEAKTIATAILIVIGVSALVQIVCIAVWALRRKGEPALRDWAVGFTVVALAVAVAAILFSLGMMLFNDNYPRLFSFLESYVAPVRYIGLLISML